MEEAGVSPGAKQREAAPQSAKAFCGLWAQLTLALVCGECLDVPKHECKYDPNHNKTRKIAPQLGEAQCFSNLYVRDTQRNAGLKPLAYDGSYSTPIITNKPGRSR